jgi:hypothetical protein
MRQKIGYWRIKFYIFEHTQTKINMKKGIFLITAATLLVACGGEVEENVTDNNTDEVVQDLTPERAGKAQMIFQTIPSPFETASIFEEAGAAYNSDATNSIENVSKYTTSTQQAINLGVYGTDLSYANIFDQSQESMFYMNCSKILADALGVTAAFSPETVERIEENMNNRDSMMTIVSDAFWTCDSYLKENGQDDLSALIITGGWIEGLYLGSSSLNQETPNKELMHRIAEQKYSLDNLLDLLNTYDNEQVNELRSHLEKLKVVFDKIEEKEGETTVSDDEVPVIGGGSSLIYTPEIIFEIATTTKDIRNEIIK